MVSSGAVVLLPIPTVTCSRFRPKINLRQEPTDPRQAWLSDNASRFRHLAH